MDYEILNFFLDEAFDLLSGWERACIDLENGSSQENLNNLFRMAHNLKGSSRSVGLKEFGELIHSAEDLINLMRSEKVPVNANSISILLEVHKHLEIWITSLKKDPEYVHNFTEILKKLTDLESNSQVGDHKTISDDIVKKEILASKLDSLRSEIQMGTDSVDKKESSQPTSIKNTVTSNNESIRVNSGKLDQLLQLIGELAVSQSIVYHGLRAAAQGDRSLQAAMITSYKATKEIQNAALSLRMQNLKSTFQRIERVIRDVATQTGKKIFIELIGDDIELDRSVIEKTTDALIHIVRNAVDHGIEALPEDRVNLNKKEEALIRIEASQSSAAVTLKISDDGRGLNSEKIRKKAIEKKLISPDTVLTPEQSYNLIFLPGFSTADKITDISGRGVGLDVVKQSVDQLRGKIQVQSELNQGTSFVIELPTSLSIVDVILIQLGHEKFAVQVHELDAIVDIQNQNIIWQNNIMGVTEFRNEVVSVVRLDQVLGDVSTTTQEEKSLHKPGMVVIHNGKKMIFTFTQILGQQQIVIRPLDDKIKNVFGISGSAILRDGEPGFVIDVFKLAETFFDLKNKTHQGAA